MMDPEGQKDAAGARSCPEYAELIVKYVDGAASDEERARLEAHVATCAKCRREVEGHTRVANAARDIRFVDLPEDAWRSYWKNTYNRMERTIGWALVVIGFAVVSSCVVGRFAHWIATNQTLNLAEKLGLGAVVAGLVVIVVGVVRERIVMRRFDRYRRVRQ